MRSCSFWAPATLKYSPSSPIGQRKYYLLILVPRKQKLLACQRSTAKENSKKTERKQSTAKERRKEKKKENPGPGSKSKSKSKWRARSNPRVPKAVSYMVKSAKIKRGEILRWPASHPKRIGPCSCLNCVLATGEDAAAIWRDPKTTQWPIHEGEDQYSLKRCTFLEPSGRVWCGCHTRNIGLHSKRCPNNVFASCII